MQSLNSSKSHQQNSSSSDDTESQKRKRKYTDEHYKLVENASQRQDVFEQALRANGLQQRQPADLKEDMTQSEGEILSNSLEPRQKVRKTSPQQSPSSDRDNQSLNNSDNNYSHKNNSNKGTPTPASSQDHSEQGQSRIQITTTSYRKEVRISSPEVGEFVDSENQQQLQYSSSNYQVSSREIDVEATTRNGHANNRYIEENSYRERNNSDGQSSGNSQSQDLSSNNGGLSQGSAPKRKTYDWENFDGNEDDSSDSDVSKDSERRKRRRRDRQKGDNDTVDDTNNINNNKQSNGVQKQHSLAYDKNYDMTKQSRTIDSFSKLKQIQKGTYGQVYRAYDNDKHKIVALKMFFPHSVERWGFPHSALREINLLVSLSHQNIVNVDEVVVGREKGLKELSVYMVMEFVEHDLRTLMSQIKKQNSDSKPFKLAEVKNLMHQLLAGVEYLHDNWIIHRDLKPANLLYSNKGELKVCDFGMAREFQDPLQAYTPSVVTPLYRAPEKFFGCKQYSTALDIWSCGCIMAEFLTGKILFNGKSDFDIIQQMVNTLGSITDDNWPGFKDLEFSKKWNVPKSNNNLESTMNKRMGDTSIFSDNYLSRAGFNLLEGLLTYDPEKRLNAKQALEHPWFTENPKPLQNILMPTYPSKYNKT